MLRVWTPPGYQKDNAPEGGYPVLVMNDGKNLYEDWLAHQGVSWNIGYCAADLIGNGILPPFIVVGIDSPGPFRSQCYLPFPPGCGAHDHRPDAARWPGGDVESYMERIVGEAKLTGKNTLSVEGTESKYDHIILATGSASKQCRRASTQGAAQICPRFCRRHFVNNSASAEGRRGGS